METFHGILFLEVPSSKTLPLNGPKLAGPKMDPSKLGHLVRIFRSKDRYGFEFGRMDPFMMGICSLKSARSFGREFFGLDQ